MSRLSARLRLAVHRGAIVWAALAWTAAVPLAGAAEPRSEATETRSEAGELEHAPAERLEAGLDEADAETLARYRRLLRPPRGMYGRLGTAVCFGRGLRFNNPYRLQTQLGDSAESLSLTASYLDLGLAMSFGDPAGIQHGGALHISVALEGVGQQAMSLAYALGYRGDGPWSVYGRLGPSLLVSPDANVGAELAAGGAYFFTGVFGVTAEIVGNLYFGAGTWQAEYTAYPILSAHAGLVAEWEVLP